MCKNGKKIMPTGTKQQIHTSQLHGGSYGSSIPVKPAQYQINNSVPSGEMKKRARKAQCKRQQ